MFGACNAVISYGNKRSDLERPAKLYELWRFPATNFSCDPSHQLRADGLLWRVDELRNLIFIYSAWGSRT
jgi:hypothetical protein